MTIIKQQDVDQAISMMPGELMFSPNSSGSELHSVAVMYDGNSVSFPTSRYYYLGGRNIIHERRGYVLSIPPEYQFLKVVQNEGKHVLRFCNSEGKLLAVGDFSPLDSRSLQDPSSILGALEHADIPTVSSVARLAADKDALESVEYVASEPGRKSLIDPAGELPIFALGTLEGAAPAVHVFPLSDIETSQETTADASIGTLNSECALLMLDRESDSITFSYFSPLLQHPEHLRVELAKYPQETINAVKSALLQHPLYLIVEGEKFSISENPEGATKVDDAQQARSLLRQTHLLPGGGPVFDLLEGKYALQITVGSTLLSPEDTPYKLVEQPGVISNAAVLVSGNEIPIARTHDGNLLLFRNFAFEHVTENMSAGSAPKFKKDMSSYAFEEFIKHNFVLHVPAADSGELPYINANGKLIAGGTNPLNALMRGTEYPIDNGSPDVNSTGENSAGQERQPQLKSGVPEIHGGRVQDDADNVPARGNKTERSNVKVNMDTSPDSGFVSDAQQPHSLHEHEETVGQEGSVVGSMLPGGALFNAQTGDRRHSAVLKLHDGGTQELPTCKYRFASDGELVADNMWGHSVVIPKEYHFLKVVSGGVEGQPRYELAFCNRSGEVLEPHHIVRYYRDNSHVSSNYGALPDESAISDAVNPQFVAVRDTLGASLKDLYEGQGQGPAITLSAPTGAGPAFGTSLVGGGGDIMGKLASNSAYFEFEAYPYYAHTLHYGKDSAEIQLANPESIHSTATRAARQMLLVLTREGFVYSTYEDVRDLGDVQFVRSLSEYKNFVAQAERILGGGTVELDQPLAARFRLEKSVVNQPSIPGPLYEVSIVVDEHTHPLKLSDVGIYFAYNALDLVHIPSAGHPVQLCAYAALGEQVLREMLQDFPITVREVDHDAHLKTSIVSQGKVLIPGAVDLSLRALPQSAEEPPHRGAYPTDGSPDTERGAGNSPFPLHPVKHGTDEREQSPEAIFPHGKGDTAQSSGNGVQPPSGGLPTDKATSSKINHLGFEHSPGKIVLPLILGEKIESDESTGGNTERFQVLLQVQDASGASNPAFPLWGYVSKNDRIIYVDKGKDYVLSLAPEHRFLKVVQNTEGGYQLALCDAAGRALTKSDFADGNAVHYPKGASGVLKGYQNFLRDDHALENTGRIVSVDESGNRVVVDLSEAYSAQQGALPYFRLDASEPGAHVSVKYNTGNASPSGDPMFLHGKYALFELNLESNACKLLLSGDAIAAPNRHGVERFVVLDKMFQFAPTDREYIYGMAPARIKALEGTPLYAEINGARLEFTTTPGSATLKAEDPETAYSFMRFLANPGAEYREPYCVRIVAVDKQEMGLQGVGVKVGSNVIEMPISSPGSGGIGFASDAPLRIVWTNGYGRKLARDIQGDPLRKVLSEFLSQHVVMEIREPSGQDHALQDIVHAGRERDVFEDSFIPSLIAHNGDKTVGRSTDELLIKIRKARHIGVDGEHNMDTDEPLEHASYIPDSAKRGSGSPTDHPVEPQESGGGSATDTGTSRLYVDLNMSNLGPLFGVRTYHDKKLLTAPSVSYHITGEGKLLVNKSSHDSQLLDAWYAKVVQLHDGSYALRLCDAEGGDLDLTYRDVDEPGVIPHIPDWALDRIYESTTGVPAFKLQKAGTGAHGNSAVVLVPLPNNYLHAAHGDSGVAHLNTDHMGFMLGKDYLALFHCSTANDFRCGSLVWRFAEDRDNKMHDVVLSDASNAQPLYMVVRGTQIAWAMDADANDLEFIDNPYIKEWLQGTWSGDSDQQVVLKLTIGSESDGSGLLRMHILNPDGVLQIPERPGGDGLYFDKDAYSICVRKGQATYDDSLLADSTASAWRLKMLASVVPYVFSLEARNDGVAGETSYHVVKDSTVSDAVDIAPGLYPVGWREYQPLVQQRERTHTLEPGHHPVKQAGAEGDGSSVPRGERGTDSMVLENEEVDAQTAGSGGYRFDAQQWSVDSQNSVFITEPHSSQSGSYELWINAGYENMARFHENVNEKYRTGEYWYAEAIELYNSITTESCRHQQDQAFPVVGGHVDMDGQVTVRTHYFGSIEALNRMFEL
ncbi:hypothetical protein OC188_00860 [Anaplasma capra]|nr:hypothetical protein [Anaplasma capra]MCU7612684.1 hypothetical protein [Anaplasma capra]